MSRFRTVRGGFAVIAMLGFLGAGVVAASAHSGAPAVVQACLACGNNGQTTTDAVFLSA